MVFDEKFVFFHFPGLENLKNGDNLKSPKSALLGFAMQQEQWREINFPSEKDDWKKLRKVM